MHTSIRLETPCEFINVTPLNPLISKCQIKVCYVGDEPNRNKTKNNLFISIIILSLKNILIQSRLNHEFLR